MRRIILALAVGVLGLAVTGGVAEAQGGRPYHAVHARPFAGGHYYPGRAHSHWGHRVWSPTFNRYHYWDAGLRSYFYWCPQRGGYYPCP